MECMMVNEFFFFADIFLVIGFAIGAACVGKSALTAFIALNAVLANLFVVKQMELFGLIVTCSDVFAVGSILGLNLLQEFFGKDAAKQAIKISFCSLVLFILVSQIHLWYVPAVLDRTHAAFTVILSSSSRIVAASIAVYFFVQKIDVLLFQWLQKIFSGRKLALRMGISLILTQFIDTVLFTFAGLYGLVSSVCGVIAISFMVKCLVIVCGAPLGALSRKFRKETV